MSSSSSSSSDDSGAKPRKKGKAKQKKGKREKKKAKHAEKKAKRADKKAGRAEAWQCDRAEAVRLTKQLLVLDAGIADELKGVFESIDNGDTVRIEGLESRSAKKKLRHLLQALKLAPAEGQGFRTASRKVSFAALFLTCLADAQQRPTPPAQQQPAAAAAAGPRAAADEDGRPVDAGDEEAGGGVPLAGAATTARPRVVGPQLPMPGVGPVAQGGSSEEEEDVEDGQGPRLEGAERKGIDLDAVPAASRREDWMTQPHESIAAAFGDCSDRLRKVDKFEVKRSKEEQEAFENMFRERGPSLLQEQLGQKFVDHEEEMERARKRKCGIQDIWGMSVKEQEQSAAFSRTSAAAPKRAFDPETDLRVTKPITGEDFSQLVEKSGTDLAGRFSRGQLATSFL